jgi:hypothetical protein
MIRTASSSFSNEVSGSSFSCTLGLDGWDLYMPFL